MAETSVKYKLDALDKAINKLAYDALSERETDFVSNARLISAIEAIEMYFSFKEEREEVEKEHGEEMEAQEKRNAKIAHTSNELKNKITSIINNCLCVVCKEYGFQEDSANGNGICHSKKLREAKLEAVDDVFNLLGKYLE